MKIVRKKRAEQYGKRKYKKAREKLSDSIENVLHLTLNDCDNCSVLIQELKEKLQKIQLSKEKCRVLTLAPHSWAIKETANFFGESKYFVGQVKGIRDNHGILQDLPEKSCHGISIELKENVFTKKMK